MDVSFTLLLLFLLLLLPLLSSRHKCACFKLTKPQILPTLKPSILRKLTPNPPQENWVSSKSQQNLDMKKPTHVTVNRGSQRIVYLLCNWPKPPVCCKLQPLHTNLSKQHSLRDYNKKMHDPLQSPHCHNSSSSSSS